MQSSGIDWDSPLDFSEAQIYTVGETEWTTRYGYEPMVRAFYCKEFAGFTTEELHEYLADAERARTLGFSPNQFAADKTAPGRITLGRAWRDQFPDQLKTFIQTSAEHIPSDCARSNLKTRAISPAARSSATSTARRRN